MMRLTQILVHFYSLPLYNLIIILCLQLRHPEKSGDCINGVSSPFRTSFPELLLLSFLPVLQPLVLGSL